MSERTIKLDSLYEFPIGIDFQKEADTEFYVEDANGQRLATCSTKAHAIIIETALNHFNDSNPKRKT